MPCMIVVSGMTALVTMLDAKLHKGLQKQLITSKDYHKLRPLPKVQILLSCCIACFKTYRIYIILNIIKEDRLKVIKVTLVQQQ